MQTNLKRFLLCTGIVFPFGALQIKRKTCDAIKIQRQHLLKLIARSHVRTSIEVVHTYFLDQVLHMLFYIVMYTCL